MVNVLLQLEMDRTLNNQHRQTERGNGKNFMKRPLWRGRPEGANTMEWEENRRVCVFFCFFFCGSAHQVEFYHNHRRIEWIFLCVCVCFLGFFLEAVWSCPAGQHTIRCNCPAWRVHDHSLLMASSIFILFSPFFRYELHSSVTITA